MGPWGWLKPKLQAADQIVRDAAEALAEAQDRITDELMFNDPPPRDGQR